MIGKLLKENLLLILLSAFILLLTIPAYGNEVYINQVGTNVEVTIVQDGQNNRISTKSTAASNATLYGQNQTINFTQTGNNNKIGLYKHYYGSDNQTSSNMTALQEGSNNTMYLDNHGDNNNFAATQKTHNSTMDLEIDYDGNTVDARQRCHDGSSCEQDRMILNAYQANNNNIKLGQGYLIETDGSFGYDGDEHGGHYMNLYVRGDNNDIIMSQRNQETSTEHYQNVYIFSDDNDVILRQTHSGDKTIALTIQNDDNNVDIYQKKGGNHTASVNLSGSYGTNLDLNQSHNTVGQSYSLSQNCQTVGGCSIAVTQN